MTSPAVLLAALRIYADPKRWERNSIGWLGLDLGHKARSAIAAFEAEQKEETDRNYATLSRVTLSRKCVELLRQAISECDDELVAALAPEPQSIPSSSEPDDFASAERIAYQAGSRIGEAARAAQPTTPDDFANATQIATAVLDAHWRDPALSTLAREYLRLAGQRRELTDEEAFREWASSGPQPQESKP